MSLRSFLRGEGPATRTNGPDAARWALEVSASGGPEAARVWWTPERVASLGSRPATFDLLDDLVASPTWSVHAGDLARARSPEGEVARFWVWASDLTEPGALCAVALPSPLALLMPYGPPPVMRDEVLAFRHDWAAFWPVLPPTYRTESASGRMNYLWDLGLSKGRLSDALIACLRAESHHVPQGEERPDRCLDVATRFRKGLATRKELVAGHRLARRVWQEFLRRDGEEQSEGTRMALAVAMLLRTLLEPSLASRELFSGCLHDIMMAAAQWRLEAERRPPPWTPPCGGRPDLDALLCAEIPFTEAMLACAAQTQAREARGQAPDLRRLPGEPAPDDPRSA